MSPANGAASSPASSSAAKPKAAPSSSFSSTSTSSSSSSPTKRTPLNIVPKPRPRPKLIAKNKPVYRGDRPSTPSTTTGARKSAASTPTSSATARRSTRGAGTSEPLLQLGSPSRDHRPAVRVQSKPTPPLEDSAMSAASISAAGTGGALNPPMLSTTSANYNAAAIATPNIATSTSALATPTSTSPSATPTMANTTGGVGDGVDLIDPTKPWKHPDELEYICRQDWGQDRMITYLCHHAFSVLPREAPLPILNPELLATDDGNGGAKTTIYQHNLYQTLGAAVIAGGAGAIGNTTTKTKSKPNPFVGIVLRETAGSHADTYASDSSTSSSANGTSANDDTATNIEHTGSTVVYLPRGYRIPLMFVGKFQWESLRLVLTSGNPDGEWEEFKFDIVHLSRLCTHLLRNAERVCKEDLGSSGASGANLGASSPSIGSINGSPAIGGGGTPSVSAAGNKSQANNLKEPRIGAMDRHWRCPMFDRALVRFYRKWMICREWSVKLFWEEFGEEEYEFDVLKHDWARWVLKGHKGFLCTKEEVEGGITADQFTAGLDRTDEGKWVWDNEKYVQNRNGIALVGGNTTTTTVNGGAGTSTGVAVNASSAAAATSASANGNGNQNASANGGATAPDLVVVSSNTPKAPLQGDIGLKVKKEVVEAVIPPSVSSTVNGQTESVSTTDTTSTTPAGTIAVLSSATTPIVPIMAPSVFASAAPETLDLSASTPASASAAKPIEVLSRTVSQASNATSASVTPTPTSTTTATTAASAMTTAPIKTTNGVSAANGTVPAQVAGKKRARTEDEGSPAVQRAASVTQKAGEAQSKEGGKENGKEKEKERDESERKRVKVMDQEKEAEKEKEKEKELATKAPSTTSIVTSTKLKSWTTTDAPGSVSKAQQALPTPPQTSTSTSSMAASIPLPQKQPASTTTGPVKHTQAILEYLGHRIVIRRDQNGKGAVDDLSKVPFVKGATLKFSIAPPPETPSGGRKKGTLKEREREKEEEKAKGKGWTFSWEEEIRTPLLPSSVPRSRSGGPLKRAPCQWEGEWRPPYIKFVPGDTWGLVGFHRAISRREMDYVTERVLTLGGKNVKWERLSEEEERAFQIERAQVAARAAFVQLDENTIATAAPAASTSAPTPASTNNATTTTASSTSTATKATATSSTTKVPTLPKEKDENAMDIDEDGNVTMGPVGGKDTVVQEVPPSRSSAPVSEVTSTTAAKEKAVDPKPSKIPDSPSESEYSDEFDDDLDEDESESDGFGVGFAFGDLIGGAGKDKSEEPVKNSQKVIPRASAFTIKKPLYTKPTGNVNSVPPPPPPPQPPSGNLTVEAAKTKTGEKRKLDVVDEKSLSPSLERTLSTKLEDAVKAITSKIREEFEEARQRDLARFAEERKREERERKREVEDIRQVVEEVKLQIIEFQQQTQSQVVVKQEGRHNVSLPPETTKILEALLGLLEGNKRLTNLVTDSTEGIEEILVTVVDLVAEVCKESKRFGDEQRSVREEVDRRMGDVVRGVEDVVHEVVATKSIVVDRRNESENQRAADEIERAEREKRVVDEVERRMEGRFGMVMEGIWRLDKELGRERERRREWEEAAVLQRQRDEEARPRVSRVENGSGSGSGVRAVEVMDVGIQAEPVGDEDRALVKRRRLDTDVTMVDLHERHHQEESASTASALKHSNPSKAKKVLDVMRNMADILELTTYDEEQVSANLVERHQTVSAKGKERQRDPDLWVETRSESTLLSLLLDEFKLIKDQLRASERRGREEIATLRLLHSAEMEKLRNDLSREREETDGGGIARLRKDVASLVDRRADEVSWGRDHERDRDRRQRDDYASEGGVNAEISELRKRLAQLESRASHSQQPPRSASVSASTPDPHRRERSSSIASSSNFEPRVGTVANGNGVAGGSVNVRGGVDWNRRAGSTANGYTSAGPSRRPSVSVGDALDADMDGPSVPLPVKTQRKLMRGMPPPD